MLGKNRAVRKRTCAKTQARADAADCDKNHRARNIDRVEDREPGRLEETQGVMLERPLTFDLRSHILSKPR